MKDNLLLIVQKHPVGLPTVESAEHRILQKINYLLTSRNALEPLADWRNKVWFTRMEAAKYLSVSAKTIDRCRIKKDLPYYQLEGTATMRFKRQDLDRLMN